MLKSSIFTLVICLGGIFLMVSCESAGDDLEENKMNPEKRDPRFFQCYYEEDLAKNKCDSVLMSFFGVEASSYLKLNDELSFIGSDEGDDLEMLAFGDENCCLPRTYDLVYDIILDKDTIFQIPMVAGSEMIFDFISEDEKRQLEGYKFLLSKQLQFDYRDLVSLMKKNNLNPEIYEIELSRDTLLPRTNLNAYFWDISFISGEYQMGVAQVNAMTSQHSGFRPLTRMGD